MTRLWGLLCAGLLLAGPALADEPARYNQVRLQSQESESVSNDTMYVTLIASGEARDAADGLHGREWSARVEGAVVVLE